MFYTLLSNLHVLHILIYILGVVWIKFQHYWLYFISCNFGLNLKGQAAYVNRLWQPVLYISSLSSIHVRPSIRNKEPNCILLEEGTRPAFCPLCNCMQVSTLKIMQQKGSAIPGWHTRSGNTYIFLELILPPIANDISQTQRNPVQLQFHYLNPIRHHLVV